MPECSAGAVPLWVRFVAAQLVDIAWAALAQRLFDENKVGEAGKGLAFSL